jgi:hypothetical protein
MPSAPSKKLSRRDCLLIGTTGLAGLSLAEILRAENRAGIGSSFKGIIHVHLDGGPPQLDTIDPKPLAPAEIRGEFAAIETAVPGLHLCEHLPRLAAMAGRFNWIRSLVGSAGAHNAFQCQSGFDDKDLQSSGGRPALGCVVSKLQGSPSDYVPAFVDLMQGRPLVRNSARPGFLGPSYQPFRPDLSRMFPRELEPAMKGELVRLGDSHQTSLTLHAELDFDRLYDRQRLRDALDGFRRDVDGSGMMSAMDRFGEQAASILTSGRLAEALDLDREDPRTLARYHLDAQSSTEEHYTSEGPVAAKKFLLARRLIEAGVRCVSLSLSDFDTHSNNFGRMRLLLPVLDVGLSALVADLEERGLLQDVLIVAWGEFGRTPRIDPKTAGRHHWPQVGPAILAGGGFRAGQVIGQTDREAAVPVSRPVHYKDVFATAYRHLGIDPHRTTLTDPQGRPQHLLDAGTPLQELT